MEAVIVATARTPIGRANKGSLVECRPDDLSADIIAGAARQGARARSRPRSRTSSGAPRSPRARPDTTWRGSSPSSPASTTPGTTVNRYCSSSLQTIRMAAHAIKAGEGDVFVAGGVETVSRFAARASSDGLPGTHNPKFADAARAQRGPPRRAASRRGRRPRASPTSTSRWARPPRTSPSTAT